jgi:class 3 adenylate cyclase
MHSNSDEGLSPGLNAPKLEVAHVLFMDIVTFTLLFMDQQHAAVHKLESIVRQLPEFEPARKANELICITAGDGMALAFFSDPTAPVRYARDVALALKNDPKFRLRMGIHTGLVYRLFDINANRNILGGGINLAERVMSCGDGGHILISKTTADMLVQLGEWAGAIHDLGEVRVKNGVRLHIYNVFTEEFGNSQTPVKMRGSRWKWLLAGSIAGSIAVVTTAGFMVQRKQPIRAELRTGWERIECVTFNLCTQPPLPKPPPPPPDSAGVTVADSLPIQITLDADVPADGSGGETLSFTVLEDLKAGDTVVIPKGATVSGSIEVGKKIFLWGGKMNYRLTQADAVDGQKLNIRATAGRDGKGRASRPFDTGKGSKSKELAAAKGTKYVGYTDGEQTLWVRK